MKKIDILDSTTSQESLKWIIEDISKNKNKIQDNLEVEIYNNENLVSLIIEFVKKRKFLNLDLVVDKGETYLYAEKVQMNDLINIYLYLNNIKIKKKRITWREINSNKNFKKWEELGFITQKKTMVDLSPEGIPEGTKEIILSTKLNTVLYHDKLRYIKGKEKIKNKEKCFLGRVSDECKKIMSRIFGVKK